MRERERENERKRGERERERERENMTDETIREYLPKKKENWKMEAVG